MTTAALITPGHADWQRLVTASKVAAILGLSPWDSPRSMWHKMRGDIPDEPTTPAQASGLFLEDGILDWYFSDNPQLRRLGKTTVRHPRLPWAAATPDEMAEDATTGEVVAIDAKTDRRGTFGEPGTDQVPDYYYTQALWVMHLGDLARFTFVVLGPFLERAEYPVTYDGELAADIEARCHTFWLSLDDISAAPALDDTRATYNAVRATVPVGEGDWEAPPDLAVALLNARAAIELAEPEYRLARTRCLDAMGDAKRVVWNGQVIAQKQKTKSGVALYPPRKPIVSADLPITDTTEDAA